MRLQKGIRFFGQLLLVAVLAQIALAQNDHNGSLNGFDEYVRKAMQEWETPGVAIVIVKDDQIVLAKGYGVRKIGEPAVVDERTLFAIGSSSKAFTAAAIAILVDQGKLKWDDPVTKHLPGFEMYDPYVTRELTVRDLLTHRSGLQRGDFLWYGSELDRDEIVRRARFLKPSWSLRSTFGYQNIMYLTAGQLVAKVSGQTWDQFIQQHIFQPLAMNSSSTSINAFKTADNVASPHAKVDEKVQLIPWRNIDNIAPAGSINSNVLDMAQWVRLQLGQGAIKNERVFSAAVAKEMHASQTVIRFEPPFAMYYPDAHFFNYGMGWFLSDYRGRKVVEHGGAIDGMRAQVALIPEEKLGLVVLSNLNGSGLPVALMYRIFDSFLGAPPRDWSAELLKSSKSLESLAKAAEKKQEGERAAGTKPSVSLDKYAGVYRNDLYGDVKISNNDTKLNLRFGPAFTSDLEHWHYDTFRARFFAAGDAKILVTFALNAQGKVDTVVLGMPGMADYPFKRVAEK
ncbi:MAG TPA: serine hydrolase [Pyrinomonadaceae bacterium]|nr:serine hydrolase [Pyrinomonadaceae bacterium]